MNDLGSLYSWFAQYGFLFRLCFDLAVIFVIVRVVYYPRHRNTDYFFTFFLFNVVIFLLCSLLSSATLNIGFAFGLFAIFSILRYRTVTVPIREMGYFFVSITVAVINALAEVTNDVGFLILTVSNLLVIGIIVLLDRRLSMEREGYKEVIYDNLALIVPARREELILDLRRRIGLPFHRVEIVKVDFPRKCARMRGYYMSLDVENGIEENDTDD